MRHEKRQRRARQGRNPKTGQLVKVDAKQMVRYGEGFFTSLGLPALPQAIPPVPPIPWM